MADENKRVSPSVAALELALEYVEKVGKSKRTNPLTPMVGYVVETTREHVVRKKGGVCNFGDHDAPYVARVETLRTSFYDKPMANRRKAVKKLLKGVMPLAYFFAREVSRNVEKVEVKSGDNYIVEGEGYSDDGSFVERFTLVYELDDVGGIARPGEPYVISFRNSGENGLLATL